jgi:hypothetical protein
MNSMAPGPPGIRGEYRRRSLPPFPAGGPRGEEFLKIPDYRLAFAARRLRRRKLIISTPAEKASEK